MIRINEPCTLSRHLLVYSDLPDPLLARQEVVAYAASAGCQLPENPRCVSIFEGEQVAREWVILERPTAFPAPAPVSSQTPALRLWLKLRCPVWNRARQAAR